MVFYEKAYFSQNLLRPKTCNFIKKENVAQVLSYDFCKIFRNIFFTERFRATASVKTVLLH